MERNFFLSFPQSTHPIGSTLLLVASQRYKASFIVKVVAPSPDSQSKIGLVSFANKNKSIDRSNQIGMLASSNFQMGSTLNSE